MTFFFLLSTFFFFLSSFFLLYSPFPLQFSASLRPPGEPPLRPLRSMLLEGGLFRLLVRLGSPPWCKDGEFPVPEHKKRQGLSTLPLAKTVKAIPVSPFESSPKTRQPEETETEKEGGGWLRNPDQKVLLKFVQGENPVAA